MRISLYFVQTCLFVLICIFLANFPIFAAHPQLFGQLTIEGNDEVQVNDLSITKEITIESGVKVATSVNSQIKVNFSEIGRINLAPDSQMILYFNENKISVNLKKGKLRLATAPNIAITIQTAGGIVTNADLTANTIVEIEYVKGKTRLKTESGIVALNGKIIPANQTNGNITTNEKMEISSFYFSVLDILVKSLYLEKMFDENLDTNVPFATDIAVSGEGVNVGPVR